MTDTPDWNQESIDERLRALAAEHYHRPDGAVPRDAMWATIVPAWQAERVVMTEPRRGFRAAPWRWSAVLAAGLLIGVALDRGIESRLASSRTAAVVPTRSAAVASSHATTQPTQDSVVPPTAPATIDRVPASRPPQLAAREPERANLPRQSSEAPSTARAPLGATAQTLYHAAAIQTLAQAEALLTSYRRADEVPGAHDQESMLQAARWARDVLSSTRLLLDSPASRDPQLRALLADLELVLAQIVQLSGTPLQAGERELIERAMRDRDLLPRLRSAVPAGTTTS
ncbi:MAG: hypothetical protein M3Z10_00205 [Gemmatimonadota bacterium]|nr:hypothetical protein [Gemmatimonadota bacterium]